MAWKIPFTLIWLALAVPVPQGALAQDSTPAEETQAAQTSEPAGDQAGGASDDGAAGGNDQTWVVGFGFGSHAFDTNLRTGSESTGLEVISAFMSQFYGEWYVFDTFGVGARFITFGERVTATTTVIIGSDLYASNYEADLSVDTVLATVHWVPLGGRRYARMGVLAGIGSTKYEFTETYTPGRNVSESTSGPAALLGVYVDWGADGFGARLGMQYLSAKLGDINGREVDASGREINLDLRWAF